MLLHVATVRYLGHAGTVAVATDGCDARIISLNGDIEKKLVDKFPYYAFATIPNASGPRPAPRESPVWTKPVAAAGERRYHVTIV